MTEKFRPVKLTAPNGTEHTAHSAIELNNLVYGQGYKPQAEPDASADDSNKPTDEPKSADAPKTPETPKSADSNKPTDEPKSAAKKP